MSGWEHSLTIKCRIRGVRRCALVATAPSSLTTVKLLGNRIISTALTSNLTKYYPKTHPGVSIQETRHTTTANYLYRFAPTTKHVTNTHPPCSAWSTKHSKSAFTENILGSKLHLRTNLHQDKKTFGIFLPRILYSTIPKIDHLCSNQEINSAGHTHTY